MFASISWNWQLELCFSTGLPDPIDQTKSPPWDFFRIKRLYCLFALWKELVVPLLRSFIPSLAFIMFDAWKSLSLCIVFFQLLWTSRSDRAFLNLLCIPLETNFISWYTLLCTYTMITSALCTAPSKFTIGEISIMILNFTSFIANI